MRDNLKTKYWLDRVKMDDNGIEVVGWGVFCANFKTPIKTFISHIDAGLYMNKLK